MKKARKLAQQKQKKGYTRKQAGKDFLKLQGEISPHIKIVPFQSESMRLP
jgi:hypothetical protein